MRLPVAGGWWSLGIGKSLLELLVKPSQQRVQRLGLGLARRSGAFRGDPSADRPQRDADHLRGIFLGNTCGEQPFEPALDPPVYESRATHRIILARFALDPPGRGGTVTCRGSCDVAWSKTLRRRAISFRSRRAWSASAAQKRFSSAC